MMKYNLILLFIILAGTVYPTTSISRWFSSSYADLSATLRRYGHCVSDLTPLKYNGMNETDFLINQMKVFLDIANYDSEQLANITVLMDNICKPDTETYAISVNIDVDKYNSTSVGKQYRCRAIDESLDSMYDVFKKAAHNKTEPLDFSTIQFYPTQTTNQTHPASGGSYNLTDLINTSWIKSDTQVEHICKITDAIKEYIQSRNSNQTAQERLEKVNRPLESLMNLIDYMVEPLLGLQKRFYWESNNRFEIVYNSISNQVGNLRDGFIGGYRSYRQFLSNMFRSNNRTNTTSLNETIINTKPLNEKPSTMVNSTLRNIA